MSRRFDVGAFVGLCFGLMLLLFVGSRSGLVEHVAYLWERGRLQALRESLDTDDIHRRNHTNAVVAELVKPAVVSIEKRSRVLTLDSVLQGGADHAASSRGTREPGKENASPSPQGAEADGESDLPDNVAADLGSGFVFDAEHGYVLTNAHVVSGAERVFVRLADGRSTTGRVLGADPESDLAVIDIDLPDLHALPLAKADAVSVGEEVFAVGNPFGLEGSVTKGIVSAINRRGVLIGTTTYESLIQTDAVITPGSSGGPLVNLRGEVIGVSTAMATRNGEYDGVAFAIPVKQVRALVDDLIEGGPGMLGVWVGPLDDPETAEKVEATGWKGPGGVYVHEVIPETGAAEAGVQPGDIILSLGGKAVASLEDLSGLLAKLKPGDETTLGIWRDRRRIEIPLRISRRYAPR